MCQNVDYLTYYKMKYSSHKHMLLINKLEKNIFKNNG